MRMMRMMRMMIYFMTVIMIQLDTRPMLLMIMMLMLVMLMPMPMATVPVTTLNVFTPVVFCSSSFFFRSCYALPSWGGARGDWTSRWHADCLGLNIHHLTRNCHLVPVNDFETLSFDESLRLRLSLTMQRSTVYVLLHSFWICMRHHVHVYSQCWRPWMNGRDIADLNWGAEAIRGRSATYGLSAWSSGPNANEHAKVKNKCDTKVVDFDGQ